MTSWQATTAHPRAAAHARATAYVRLLGLALCLVAACGRTALPAPDGGTASDGGLPQSDGGSQPDGGGPVPVHVRVTAVVPGRGPAAGGTQALVSGSGFVDGFAVRGGADVNRVTTVRIGGAPATQVDVIDDNRLQLVTPAGTPGPADVVVENPNGAGTCSGCFRFLAEVAVSAIEPASGPAGGGTAVTVRGRGFVPGVLVAVGGVPLVDLVVQDAQTATGRTAAAPAGAVDVTAIADDGVGRLRHGFVYRDALRLDSVAPAQTPTAGGAVLTVTGAGFSPQARVFVDDVSVDTAWVDEGHLAARAPAHAAGPADVRVEDPLALAATSASLPRALSYRDGAGALALDSLWPRSGPVAGGTCPATCLRLYGAGLAATDLTVTVGGAAALLHAVSDTQLDVDLPPGSAGAATVVVAAGGVSATLAGLFRYAPPLTVAAVVPAEVAAPGTPLTAQGQGFADSPGAPLELWIGGLAVPIAQVATDGASLTAAAPAAAQGPADVTVVATDADGTRRSATLAGGLRIRAPLVLRAVQPPLGAQAGGTQVTLLGSGFVPGLVAQFGSGSARQLTVLSPTEATVLTPPGTPGPTVVSAALGSETAQLRDGFVYFDPGTSRGGAGGGLLLGTLNVTVLDGTPYLGGGLAGASVAVRLADGATLAGTTDARGQLTFSDERLVGAVQLTAIKAQYTAATVEAVQAANVTVFLSGPVPPPPPPPDPPPDPPPPPLKATIGGHVFGFKAPPDLVLAANQRLVAYVRTTRTSLFGAPPFSPEVKPLVVDHDGGTWSFETTRLSPFTVYATFGIETTQGQLTSFQPLLLGVRRDVVGDPARPLTDADVILDTHLDRTVRATLSGLPDLPDQVRHEAAVSLDLGSGGILPLGEVQSAGGTTLDFPALPLAAGQGFVFVDQAIGAAAVSTYLRRVFGDVSLGLPLGPYLPFPKMAEPLPGGALQGRLAWTLAAGGLQPNLLQLLVSAPGVNWTVLLPGTAREVLVPPEVRARLSGNVGVSLTASLAPGFEYAFWTYNDLYGSSWTAYAYGGATFTVAP